ncbi:uncharacterized protein LOC111870159 isoform X2 [Cryptotermes secundus]|uniref:uncharacterized protein LOC111870159 isoform X2 n=1 Tax=Cryptotermes secundus TaxID=105785 RepID=UPI000CD7C619|nr:uncharacterized protein LOC111870159 isoform X2 [Cryptotermes secundus]
MTPMTNPMMTMTTMTGRNLLRSLGTPRLCVVLLLLVVIDPVFSGYSWGHPSRDWSQQDDDKVTPEFEIATSSVTALVGQPVYLPCRVRNLRDRVVSWIRTRDLHILTSGTLTYTSDSRFEVLHAPGSEVWTLRIMSAQPRDQGKYECQVNTDPKLNFAVFLTVKETDMGDSPWDEGPPVASGDEAVSVAATASIMGPRELYIHQGSTLTFTCVIPAPYTQGSRPPRVVDWFHSGRPVSIQENTRRQCREMEIIRRHLASPDSHFSTCYSSLSSSELCGSWPPHEDTVTILQTFLYGLISVKIATNAYNYGKVCFIAYN